jgi:hypothetical protein
MGKPLEQNIAEGTYFLGEDMGLEYHVLENVVLDPDTKDANGNPTIVSADPVDVTGWNMSWILRVSQEATDPALITKTVGSGVTITGTYSSVFASNAQRVFVSIADTDTYDDTVSPTSAFAAPKEYAYSLKRTDGGSERVLVWGVLPLGKVTNRA